MVTAAADPAAERTLAVMRGLFGERFGRDVGVRLWDGTAVVSPNATVTLNLNTPYALRAALTGFQRGRMQQHTRAAPIQHPRTRRAHAWLGVSFASM